MTYEELYGEALPVGWEIREGTYEFYYKQDVKLAKIHISSGSLSPLTGRISIQCYTPTKKRWSIRGHLEKHFRNPFKPTEEERTLFEIEHGFSYPFQ